MLEQFTLIEHLTEFRKRLVRIIVIVVLLFIGAYTQTDRMVDWILRLTQGIHFIYTKPEELLMSYLKIDILVALVLAIPFIAFECWRFVKPALKKAERNKGRVFFLMATLFFFAGVYFSLRVTTPFCLRFFAEFTNRDITAMLSIENYLSFIINMTFVFGLVFDVPAIVYFLASLKIIRFKTLKRYGKYIVLVLLIIAAVLTPPDIISQLMLFVPLLLIYEFSLFICYAMEKEIWKKIVEKLKKFWKRRKNSMD